MKLKWPPPVARETLFKALHDWVKLSVSDFFSGVTFCIGQVRNAFLAIWIYLFSKIIFQAALTDAT